MQSEFKPKHLQRAKETLQRQLQVVQEEITTPPENVQEKRSLWKRLLGFFSRLK
jgi:hypothetical protein